MNATGIAYIEFQNVSAESIAAYLPLLQLALSCSLQTIIKIRWFIEKTGIAHTLYNNITLPHANLTECGQMQWPSYQHAPASPYSVGVNYEITTLTSDILAMNLLEFNTYIEKSNQIQSVASLLGSPYFFSAAPVQLLQLYTAVWEPTTSSANMLTLSASILFVMIAIIVQSIV
jgi:hypothetical protein